MITFHRRIICTFVELFVLRAHDINYKVVKRKHTILTLIKKVENIKKLERDENMSYIVC